MAVKKVTVEDLVPQIKKPWMPVVLGSVEDYQVKLAEFKGEYFWHRHQNHDEFMYVWRGNICIDVKEGKPVTLKSGESAFVEKGTVHRSKASRKAMVLLFERNTILSDFVRVE